MNRTGSKLNLHPFREDVFHTELSSTLTYTWNHKVRTHKRCQTELIIPHDSYYNLQKTFPSYAKLKEKWTIEGNTCHFVKTIPIFSAGSSNRLILLCLLSCLTGCTPECQIFSSNLILLTVDRKNHNPKKSRTHQNSTRQVSWRRLGVMRRNNV